MAILDWPALGMIISEFLQSEERARLLSKDAQLRLDIATTYVVNVAQMLSDGSISLANFRALLPKEDKFVELSAQCIPNAAAAPGTATIRAPSDTRQEYQHRAHASFADCRSRLQRYEDQNKRVVFFVERFRNFPQIGIYPSICLNYNLITTICIY